MVLSKLKVTLGGKAERTASALWDAAGNAIQLFTPDEWARYFVAACYESDGPGRSLVFG